MNTSYKILALCIITFLTHVSFAGYTDSAGTYHPTADDYYHSQLIVNIHNHTDVNCRIINAIRHHGNMPNGDMPPQTIPAGNSINFDIHQWFFYGEDIELTVSCKQLGQITLRTNRSHHFFFPDAPEGKVVGYSNGSKLRAYADGHHSGSWFFANTKAAIHWHIEDSSAMSII